MPTTFSQTSPDVRRSSATVFGVKPGFSIRIAMFFSLRSNRRAPGVVTFWSPAVAVAPGGSVSVAARVAGLCLASPEMQAR